jgi:O-antigen/teichoic acid export membrane protein
MLKKLASPAWATVEYGWYPLLLFTVTPLFLSRLGTEQYGLWMLLSATVGFGGVLNSGTGVATIKAISATIGRGEGGDVGYVVRASLAIAILGGSALAFLVFSVFWFAGGLFGQMGDPALVQLTGAVAALLLWLEQLDNVFSSALKGAEQFGHAARIEIASKTIQIFGGVAILLSWPELWALYAVLLVVAILRLLAKTMLATHVLGFSDFRPSLAGTSEILRFAKWGWLQGVGAVLFGVADRMLVGSLLGAASLTYYSIASQLAMQVHAVTAAGLSVIFPNVSRRLEDGNAFSLWRVTKLTAVGNLLLSSSIALLLVLFGQEILRLWIGPAAAGPIAEILPWLVGAYWILALNVVPYYVLLGIGRIRFVGLTAMASGAIGLIAMYVAIIGLGLTGTPAGRGVYAIVSLALIFPLAQYFKKDQNLHFKKQKKRLHIG